MTGWPLRTVVEHSVGQLKLIYAMKLRVQAEDALLDLEIAQAAAVYAQTGKPGAVNALAKTLGKQMDGSLGQDQNPASNRRKHLAGLVAMGVKTK